VLQENSAPLISSSVRSFLKTPSKVLHLSNLLPFLRLALFLNFFCADNNYSHSYVKLKKTEWSYEEYVSDNLLEAIHKTREICLKIITMESERGIIKDDEEDYLNEKINFGLTHVNFSFFDLSNNSKLL